MKKLIPLALVACLMTSACASFTNGPQPPIQPGGAQPTDGYKPPKGRPPGRTDGIIPAPLPQ